MRTIRELAKEALDCQNASNLSGLAHTFSRVVTDLREIARAEGWESTEKINTHPIVIVWVCKLANLATADGSDTDIHNAFRCVEDIACIEKPIVTIHRW